MIFLAVTTVIILLFVFLKKELYGFRELPPGPWAWQLLSNISQLRRNPHVLFKNLAKSYGSLFSLRLGGQLLVVASSPDSAKEILKTHDQILSGRYLPSMYYDVRLPVESSMVMSRECNETWKSLRSIVHKWFSSSKAVESKAQIRKTKIRQMVDYLRSKQGEILDIEDLVNVTVTNITSNVLASTDLLDINKDHDEKFKAILNEIVEMSAIPGLGDLFPILKGVDIWSQSKAMDMYRNIKFIWEPIILERSRRGDDASSTQDLLGSLSENAFSDDQISLLLMELLIAGSDSTTIAIIWLMVELMNNQDILQRVRDEVVEAFDGEFLNESRLSRSPYLQACIMEGLRLYPPGPLMIPHRATETCKVKNYTIPKDSILVMNAWAIQRDPNYWYEAKTFKPERFLNLKLADFRGDFKFIPFSAGNRTCPGSIFAFSTIQSVVAALVHYFDWSLPDGSIATNINTKEKFGTTLKKAEPLCLIPKLRQYSSSKDY